MSQFIFHGKRTSQDMAGSFVSFPLATAEPAAPEPSVSGCDLKDDLAEDSDNDDDDDDDDDEEKEEPENEDPNWTPEKIDEAYQKLGEDSMNNSQSTKPR